MSELDVSAFSGSYKRYPRDISSEVHSKCVGPELFVCFKTAQPLGAHPSVDSEISNVNNERGIPLVAQSACVLPNDLQEGVNSTLLHGI